MSDMLAKLSAEFPREKIHWRAQSVTKDGTKAMALAYLDSRDVQERLDEVCGPENWQNKHYDCGGGKLGCEIEIRIGGEWVRKSDGAGDTQVEAEKGAFSSAFKRAAVLWGIGRYLYDMPTPWVSCESYQGKDGKYHFRKFTANPWDAIGGPKPAAQPRAAAPQQAPSPAPQAAPSLWEQDEYRIPVRPLPDGKGSNWQMWDNTMRAAAEKAPNADAVRKLWNDNAAAIESYAEFHKDARMRLEQHFDQKAAEKAGRNAVEAA